EVPKGADAATVELEDKPIQSATHFEDGVPRADLDQSAQLHMGKTTSLSGKLSAAGMAIGGVWTAVNVGMQIASLGSPAAMAGGVALTAASLFAGYAAADLGSGFFHHFIDNYPDEHTPVIGAMAKEFQEHHFRTYDLLESTFLDNCENAGKFIAPAAVASAAINPHYAVQAAFLAFSLGSYLAQGSHRWTHTKDVPAIGKFMQKVGLAQGKKSHAIHHRMPWDDHYCIVNGMWNPLASKIDLWRRVENFYYKAFGAEPKSWRDPGVRALALGEITKDEFLEKQGINRKIFSEIIKGEREYWRQEDERRREGLPGWATEKRNDLEH
ncbi:MAG: fatty acid desaturase CarF family protein, partial [Candidatus Eremiobacterota bacterium]